MFMNSNSAANDRVNLLIYVLMYVFHCLGFIIAYNLKLLKLILILKYIRFVNEIIRFR